MRLFAVFGLAVWFFDAVRKNDGYSVDIKYSRVKLGVLFKPTVYVDEHTLKVENIYFYDGTPEVVQCADDGTELAAAVFIPETE